jgi:hypothetical protein
VLRVSEEFDPGVTKKLNLTAYRLNGETAVLQKMGAGAPADVGRRRASARAFCSAMFKFVADVFLLPVAAPLCGN